MRDALIVVMLLAGCGCRSATKCSRPCIVEAKVSSQLSRLVGSRFGSPYHLRSGRRHTVDFLENGQILRVISYSDRRFELHGTFSIVEDKLFLTSKVIRVLDREDPVALRAVGAVLNETLLIRGNQLEELSRNGLRIEGEEDSLWTLLPDGTE